MFTFTSTYSTILKQMILYSASKTDFRNDVSSNKIEEKILSSFLTRLGRHTGQAEINSWRNSLLYMNNILEDKDIPFDSNVAIEYKIPNTSKRIDFILTGQNHEKQNSVVIIELKQWTDVEITEMDGIVKTRLGGSLVETNHPSYQAWTYASLLQDFNSTIQDQKINLIPCAYLHNCKQEQIIKNTFYKDHLDKAPVFLRDDVEKLTNFIKTHVRYGDTDGILYKIDNGKIRPSKNLSDKLLSMIQGNEEFLMIDDQKLVYETALRLSDASTAKNKNVLIVEGGPGSGKSVVAINLLVELTKRLKTTQYITKNSAPRTVYEKLLTGSFKKSHISNLFSGSGSFHETEMNTFDSLIVDEAHRLNQKSGLFSNLGENQIKEIIHSALFSVFFIDENQKVTLKDIGSKEEIYKWAKKSNTAIQELKLSSQYRCSGSDAYMAWLDQSLQIKETANITLSTFEYDFKIFNDPNKLREKIFELNQATNKSRLVAGYCWSWKSKKDRNSYDIELGDQFKMKWNLASDGGGWIIQPHSIEQVGCIHTCQGLELDYVGVIIGPDLIVRNNKIITDGCKRASGDQSIKGYKKRLKNDSVNAKNDVDLIIKNTYRTLMTRGLKGCYLYCTDAETSEYFRKQLSFEPIE